MESTLVKVSTLNSIPVSQAQFLNSFLKYLVSTVDTAPLNLISVTGLIPIGDTGSRTNKPADASEENAPHFFKKQTKRPLETTLFALQAKQVKLLETQTMQLAQIVDLLAERNSIEKEKLQIMKNN